MSTKEQNENYDRAVKGPLFKGEGETGLDAAEESVRETEDASLQDDSYSFDEANTDNEEYHDVDDADLEDFVDDSDDRHLH